MLRFTEEVAGVPHGFEAPLIHALVDLGEGRKLISRVVNCKEGQLKEGATVKLAVFDIPAMVVENRGVDGGKAEGIFCLRAGKVVK